MTTRSILAVLGGFVLFQVLTQLLETTLVAVAAAEPIADETAYFAVRNRPALLAARIAYTSVAALLSGYMAAKIAMSSPVRHAMAAAAVVMALLAWEFTGSDYARVTPMWMRIVLIAMTGPMMLAGGWIRASAEELHDPPTPNPDRGARS